MTDTVKVDVPSEIYERIKQKAEISHRSVQDELVTVMHRGLDLIISDDVSPDIQIAMDALVFKDDADLWKATRAKLSSKLQRRLETLLYKHKEDGLSQKEENEFAQLLHKSDYYMLTRSKAILLLKLRGHDIENLLT